MPDWVPSERLQLQDDFSVTYWRLPLNPTLFEERSFALRDFLRPTDRQWRYLCIALAYFSRRSDVVVFVQQYDITITNNPEHISFALRS
jgi:hypothetical protein